MPYARRSTYRARVYRRRTYRPFRRTRRYPTQTRRRRFLR